MGPAQPMSESKARLGLVQPTVGSISVSPEIVFPEGYPLCVDLDGTLLRTDSLLETWMAAFRRNPLRCLLACLQLLRGRGQIKSALAGVAIPVADQLPYRETILQLVRREAAAGREIVLTTGAAEPVAEAVARTVGCFDAVLSSNARVNHTSRQKAAELEERFGRGRFYYAGNSSVDLPVWRASAGAVVVGDSHLSRELAKSGVPVIAQVRGEGLSASKVARAMRVHQWSKNLLVFVPILLGHRFRDLGAWSNAGILLAAISLCASASYLLNDLMDLEADRAHPEKRRRPFASGALGLGFGFAGIPLLLASAAGLSWFLPASTRLWLCAYLALTFAYSIFLKERLLVDVFVLAGLYTLRVLAGGSATGIAISPWTLAFSMFLFLSLAMVKRYSELVSAAGTSDALPRRNYYRSDLSVLSSLGTASGYIAVLVLALYIHSPEVTNLYRHPLWLWMLCPLVAYWISRMWVFANRGAISSDPILFALRDRISYFVGGLSATLFLLASQ